MRSDRVGILPRGLASLRRIIPPPANNGSERSHAPATRPCARALVVGATAVVQQVRKGRGHPSAWLVDIVKRKPPKLAAVALANKNARVLWKLMVSGERYNPHRERGRFVPPTGSVASRSPRQGRFAPPSAVALSQP